MYAYVCEHERPRVLFSPWFVCRPAGAQRPRYARSCISLVHANAYMYACGTGPLDADRDKGEIEADLNAVNKQMESAKVCEKGREREKGW